MDSCGAPCTSKRHYVYDGSRLTYPLDPTPCLQAGMYADGRCWHHSATPEAQWDRLRSRVRLAVRSHHRDCFDDRPPPQPLPVWWSPAELLTLRLTCLAIEEQQ